MDAAVKHVAHEIHADCPRCRVEGALTELIAESRSSCRFCGYRVERGRVVAAGIRPQTVEEAREALAAWAAREDDELLAFVEAHFQGAGVERVVDLLLAGEPVPTSLDVLGWLMPGLGGVSRSGRGPALAPVAEPAPAPAEARPDGVAMALSSVAHADGRLDPRESALLERWGVPVGEAKVWRPAEVSRPADPAAVVARMIELARVDGEIDPTEVRVVAEFARAWGVAFDPGTLPTGQAGERVLKALFGSVFG